MRTVVLVLDDATTRELVDTLSHGALDRLRMGSPPSEELSTVVWRLTTGEQSPLRASADGRDDGVVVEQPSEYLPRAEAARIVGSESTLDRLRRGGVLEPHYRGRRVFFRRQDIEEYLNGD